MSLAEGEKCLYQCAAHKFYGLELSSQLTGFHFDKNICIVTQRSHSHLVNPVQHSQTSTSMSDITSSRNMFKYLVRRLGMRCLTPDELKVLAIESA
ncbi:hypothetical protein Tco_1321082 [Tanacetum coccineum]